MELSIIIVNYNTKKLTLECIESVKKYTQKLKYELIVVDNGSSDGSATALQKIGNIKFIQNDKNLGFAGANNQGVKAAKGEFVLLLNSDTLLTANILAPLVAQMRKDRKLGIFSCALNSKDGSTQTTGGFFPSLPKVFAWMFFLDDIPFVGRIMRAYHPNLSFYNSPHRLDWVTGAFFLTRREVWDKIGYLDEGYFMYVEELDFCFRAKRFGWEVFYDPKHSLIHYG
ncbi:hypothetical protein A2125_00310, partial [Candidatus Woesebacteria bacterium GWB1_43_5]